MRTSAQRRPAASFRYSPLIAAFACAFGTQGVLGAEFPVTSSADTVAGGTLREAISLVNAPCLPGPHTITFSGPFTINVSSPLPAITCANVEINAGANTVIIDGSRVFSSGCGLTASAPSTRIEGLTVRNFSYGGYGLCGTMEAVNNDIHSNSRGLFLYGGGSVINGNQIHGNQYGIYDADGGSTIVDNDIYSNAWDGIRLFNGGTVGGAAPAQGNRMYGNQRDIYAEDNSESGPLTISNNLIGTDGVTPNGGNAGIEIYGADSPYVISDNVIVAQGDFGISIWGSNTVGTISGNTVGGAASLGNSFGIDIHYSYGGSLTVSNNVITGNTVGIRLDYVQNVNINNNTVGGAGALGNGAEGLWASCSDDLTITANRVVGNGGDGLVLEGLSNSIIRDNLVGTPNGSADQGNGGAGIWLDGGQCYLPAQLDVPDPAPKAAKVLGGANNVLEGNTVAFNNDDGVVVFGTGNAIRGSLSPTPHGGFHSNAGKAINLSYYPVEVPPANNGQASPVLTSAQASGGSTVINLTLASLPSTNFAIDLYRNIEPQSATPDGRNYLGQVSLNTDASGNGNATVAFTGAHNYIVATATGPNGTSELSQAIVTAAADEGQLPLPAAINLGTTTLHGSPLVNSLAITNTGNAAVNFTAISATSPFEVSHNCPPSLAPGAACAASISFPPLVYGNTTGQLTVASDAAGGNRVISLLAAVSGVEYRISPASFSFGLVPVGSASPTRAFLITNDGSHAIPLSGVSVTNPFTLASSTCGARLGPGSSCTAEVAFAPTQPGAAEGTLTAQVGLPGAPPARSRLSGNGTVAAALELPSAIDFGPIVLGSTPVSQSVAVRNTGNAELTFSTSVSGPFALSGDCGPSLQPSASCNLVITFTPSEVGEFTGALAVASNAPGGSRTIPIAARVQTVPHPEIRLSVTSMEFDDRMIGTSSTARRVTVTNIGGVMAQLGITPPTRDFIATSQCGATLAPGASCTADVVFRPLAVGPRANILQVTSDAPGSPFGVDLRGRGCTPPRSSRAPSCS